MPRRVRFALALLAVAAAAPAACTAPGTAPAGRSGSSAQVTPAPTRSAGAPARPGSPPPAADPGLRRPVRHTAIGDPVTADLCAAVGLAPFRGVGAGLTAAFDDRQYPSSCSLTLRRGTTPVLTVSVFASAQRPRPAAGRTTRTVDGLRTYAYRFDSSTGACERDVALSGVLLVVDSVWAQQAGAGSALSCAATDAMAQRLESAVRAGPLPRLALARPSVTSLDGCAVLRRSGVTGLAVFGSGRVIPRGFGADCEARAGRLFLFLDPAIAAAPRPAGARPVTVGGHLIYATATGPALCFYTSPQGRTPAGRYEQVTASATVAAPATAPADLCSQTALALARYLTAAGLS